MTHLYRSWGPMWSSVARRERHIGYVMRGYTVVTVDVVSAGVSSEPAASSPPFSSWSHWFK